MTPTYEDGTGGEARVGDLVESAGVRALVRAVRPIERAPNVGLYQRGKDLLVEQRLVHPWMDEHGNPDTPLDTLAYPSFGLSYAAACSLVARGSTEIPNIRLLAPRKEGPSLSVEGEGRGSDLRTLLVHHRQTDPMAKSAPVHLRALLVVAVGNPLREAWPAEAPLPAPGFRTLFDPLVPDLLRWLSTGRLPPFQPGVEGMDAPLDLLRLFHARAHVSTTWSALSPGIALKTATDILLDLAQDIEAGLVRVAPAPERILLTWPDGATLQHLVSAEGFDTEGLGQHHCLRRTLHYWSDAAQKRSAILSYRNPEGWPEATIEILWVGEDVEGGAPLFSVGQIQGERNGDLPPGPCQSRVAAALLEWANIPAPTSTPPASLSWQERQQADSRFGAAWAERVGLGRTGRQQAPEGPLADAEERVLELVHAYRHGDVPRSLLTSRLPPLFQGVLQALAPEEDLQVSTVEGAVGAEWVHVQTPDQNLALHVTPQALQWKIRGPDRTAMGSDLFETLHLAGVRPQGPDAMEEDPSGNERVLSRGGKGMIVQVPLEQLFDVDLLAYLVGPYVESRQPPASRPQSDAQPAGRSA